ncbi:hypothetical protein PI95_032200 [Hassallia byssoidea VB512170]|uniref:Uncharacterized protein n=1 Tax=Hassallia byssoidea VB512170 TaxID=1304833 RepID=A0A846HI49_9CYAN|nr:hypothetical protein [Hassalia byssoidea]NEU77036.1 hypothetical protein [Hassalia byssoidea VB512170]
MGKFTKTLNSLPDWAKDVISLTALNLTFVLAIAVIGGSSFCLLKASLDEPTASQIK